MFEKVIGWTVGLSLVAFLAIVYQECLTRTSILNHGCNRAIAGDIVCSKH